MTYYTVFVIELQSRRVHVLGATRYPDEAFVLQAMRHLTDGTDGVWERAGVDLRSRSQMERGAIPTDILHFPARVLVIQTARVCLSKSNADPDLPGRLGYSGDGAIQAAASRLRARRSGGPRAISSR